MSLAFARRSILAGCVLGASGLVGLNIAGGNLASLLLDQGTMEETVKPSAFGAVGDGVSDDTYALQRALDAAVARGKILERERGKYRSSHSIIGKGDVRIINSGKAVIEVSKGIYREPGALVLSGRAARVGGLSRPVERGATELAALPELELARGDIGSLFDPADFSHSGFRRYYRAGEFFQVAGMKRGIISLREPVDARYDRGVDIYKIEPITGYINDIIMTSAGGPESLLVIDYANGFEINRPVVRGANNIGIAVSRSQNCSVTDPNLRNAGVGNDDYGIVWSNCQNCRLSGGKIYARRHAVAMGGADQVNGIPCRDILVEEASLRNDASAGVHCADIHGNGVRCGYRNCTIFGGFSPQGSGSFLQGSTVRSMRNGVAVYAAEIVGGQHLIEGNSFFFESDPSLGSRGAIDIGGNNDAITKDTENPLTLIVQNNKFNSKVFSDITSILNIRNAGSSNEINVRFTNNALNVNSYSYLVLLRRAGGVARSKAIKVDGNFPAPSIEKTIYPDGEYSRIAVGLS